MSNENKIPVEKKNFWKSSVAKRIYFGLIALVIIGTVSVFAWQSINKTDKSNTIVQNANSLSTNTKSATTDISGTQEIKMRVTGSSYEPSTLTVKVGQPVRWVVDGTNAVGCTKFLVASEIGISRRLNSGDNIIEFTPTKTGIISFSCSMGMVNGRFRVV
jgi:plastocyanin